MRNTLQEQYNLIKEGKGNKEHFFKSARHIFPDLITPVNSFSDAVTILKNRGVISENIGGLVTTGKKQDWHAIFNENIDKLKEGNLGHNEEWALEPEGRFWNVTYKTIDGKKEKVFQSEEEAREWIKNNLSENVSSLNESKEAKAIEKETTKEVTDMATRGYDYKDEKNYDNVFGQEFLQGYYTEMKDPKNADKHVDELRAIVAKNLAKDINHYVKDGQFGTKGVGYTTEAPGLGEPKEPKGKFKSSGYGDLKENKDPKAETSFYNSLKVGDKAIYNGPEKNGFQKGDKVEVSRIASSSTFEKTITVKKGDKKLVVKGHGSLKPLNESYSPSSLKESVLRLAIQDVIKEVMTEALDMDAIKNEGEDAKKKVMERRITNEIVKRKKQIKALETLTELEGNENNTKKVKELQSEIKKLEGAKAKLDGKKKVKEAGTYAGKKAKDDLKKDPDYNTLNTQAKIDADKKLDTGGSVTVGENKEK